MVTKPGTIKTSIITHNPELDKEDNAVFFPEKMEKAREIIARAGLPPVNRQKYIKNSCEFNRSIKLYDYFYEYI